MTAELSQRSSAFQLKVDSLGNEAHTYTYVHVFYLEEYINSFQITKLHTTKILTIHG